MVFCTRSPSSGALPCQEATCPGSGRPVCTRRRLLSGNYGLYLPARPPTRTPHGSQRDSGSRASKPPPRQMRGFRGCRAPQLPQRGPSLYGGRRNVLHCGHQEVTWGPGLGFSGRTSAPRGLIRIGSKSFFPQNCPLNIFRNWFWEADLTNRYGGGTGTFPLKFLMKTNEQTCVWLNGREAQCCL